MKLIRWKQKNGKYGNMLRITAKEGIEIISSISNQLNAKDFNAYRQEFETIDREYFSISINEEVANIKEKK